MGLRTDTPRTACADDLKNYFKKSDLLSGLTALELEELRNNIGVINGATLSEVTDITYAELNSKIINKLLNIGIVYRITDFLTMYEINKKTYSSDIILLLVIAATTSSLISLAFIYGKDWNVRYSPILETFSDGTTSKGKITYLQDDKGNSAYYDFKNVKFLRDNKLYYTFSDTLNGNIIDSSELSNTKHNTIQSDCTNNVFIGDTYNNTILPGCNNNTFYKGCINSLIGYDSTDNTFYEAVRYTSGSCSNKTFLNDNTVLSTTITKRILKVNDATIVSYLDPITYAYLVIEI